MDVLLVVASAELARVIGDVLGAAGHAVTTVGSAHAALRALTSRVPDLAIIDAHLPDLPGADVARALRDLPGGGRSIAVLLAEDPMAFKHEARRLDLVAVIRKPVDVLDLADLVHDVAAARGERADLLGVTDVGAPTVVEEPEPTLVPTSAPPMTRSLRGGGARPAFADPAYAEPVYPDAPSLRPVQPSVDAPAQLGPSLWELLHLPQDSPPDIVAARCDEALETATRAAWTERSLMDRAKAASRAAHLRSARRLLLRGAEPKE